jgi:hypothetical protein
MSARRLDTLYLPDSYREPRDAVSALQHEVLGLRPGDVAGRPPRQRILGEGLTKGVSGYRIHCRVAKQHPDFDVRLTLNLAVAVRA